MPSRKRLRPSLPAKSQRNAGDDKTRTTPFPSYPRPTSEECRAVRDNLLALHGFPQQFAKFRDLRRSSRVAAAFKTSDLDDTPPPLDVSGSSSPRESVLDGLVSILLSQNTTDANSQRAFASLKYTFPCWEEVMAAESKWVEDSIRCGGLATTKASCIKNILRCLLEKKGKLCLEYLRDLSVDEIKAELSSFKGIGPKTVACVLMFYLQRDDFPVDTHVFQIAKAMGWIPTVADRNKAYLHLNQRIPNELKFDLNCLLFTHGKLCRNCIKPGSNQPRKESQDKPCPLLSYSGNSKVT